MSETMGGWTIIYGERRFIPLWTRRKKQAHCGSCAYYSRTEICQLTGTFINRYAEACPDYLSKNKGKVSVIFP